MKIRNYTLPALFHLCRKQELEYKIFLFIFIVELTVVSFQTAAL